MVRVSLGAELGITTTRKLLWGMDLEPQWELGGEQTAPGGDQTLVSKTISSGKKGYIFGFLLTATEANNFKLQWVNSGTQQNFRIVFASEGTIFVVSDRALNLGYPVDSGQYARIRTVNAGSAGSKYQAMLLVGEM